MRHTSLLLLLVSGMLGAFNSYAQDSDTPTNKVIHAEGYTYEFQSAAAPHTRWRRRSPG